jgi:gamma-glutamyl:cysteine ligase YbdK (ATP-grasp superfamily)
MTGRTGGYRYPLGLFDAYGIELEYMIVDAETLDVRPVADALFRAVCGEEVADYEPDGPDGPIAWSNELALHVIELKTARPRPSLVGLESDFQDHVGRINALVAPMGCRLLPTGMHPWMDPIREMRLWPHENTEIYRAYDRIFGCRGHGWANLQSTHINLPFADDAEFGRLHAAVRAVIPLIPALAASSPIIEGSLTGSADHRMEVYRTNSVRVPLMAGLVVPEPVYTRAEYEKEVLGRLYDQLAPLDPEGVLRHEFANARGGMARFDRGAIEIRVMDIQECPAADLRLIRLICDVVRALTEERWCDQATLRRLSTESLHAVLLDCTRQAEDAVLRDADLLGVFGTPSSPVRAGDLWRSLAAELRPSDSALAEQLGLGTLSARIQRSVGSQPDRPALRAVYREIAGCLAVGRMFHGA